MSVATFLYLLAATTQPLKPLLPANLFLRADPLVAVAVTLASRALAPYALAALGLLFLTGVFGRFFCGLLCPLGALFDAADALGIRRLKKGAAMRWPNLRRAKFGVLIVILIAAGFGTVSLLWLDPISLATRTAALVVWPVVSRGAHALSGTKGLALALRPDVLSAGLILCLLGTVVLQTRFWCRNLCPLGATLGLAGSFGIRRAVLDHCTQCGKCRKICHTGAIAHDPRETRRTECTLCLDCQVVCPEDAIRFWWRSVRHGFDGISIPRRRFLETSVAGIAGVGIGRILRPDEARADLLRPPGARPEPLFRALCIRCGQCIKACKFNALHPVTLAEGLDGCWTPHFRMRVSGCDPDCNVCGHVCPTQAIPALPLENKNRLRIGLAEIDRKACLPWAKDEICEVCREACLDAGHDAIEFRFEAGFLRVHVREGHCTGCGWCEFRCPVNVNPETGEKGLAAIVVVPRNVQRLSLP